MLCDNQKPIKPTNCRAIIESSWVSNFKLLRTKPPYQRPRPIPVPSATIATVEIAAVDPTRSFSNAAAQNEVANSLEIQATKPTQEIQNLRESFPLCGPSSSGTCSSSFFSRPTRKRTRATGSASNKPKRQRFGYAIAIVPINAVPVTKPAEAIPFACGIAISAALP